MAETCHNYKLAICLPILVRRSVGPSAWIVPILSEGGNRQQGGGGGDRDVVLKRHTTMGLGLL